MLIDPWKKPPRRRGAESVARALNLLERNAATPARPTLRSQARIELDDEGVGVPPR